MSPGAPQVDVRDLKKAHQSWSSGLTKFWSRKNMPCGPFSNPSSSSQQILHLLIGPTLASNTSRRGNSLLPHPYTAALSNSCLHSWYLHNASTTSNSTTSNTNRRTRHLRHRPNDGSNNAKASNTKRTRSNATGDSCGTASGLLIAMRINLHARGKPPTMVSAWRACRDGASRVNA